MRSIGRSILAVLGGGFVCALVVFSVEALSSRIYPLPPDVDPADPEALRAATAELPPGAFLFVLLAWFLGPLVGAWVAARLAPGSPIVHGMIVAGLVAGSAVVNMALLPHPAWMWIAGPLAILGGGWLGSRLAGRPRTVPAV
jgi:hypothetical protein